MCICDELDSGLMTKVGGFWKNPVNGSDPLAELQLPLSF